MHYRVAEPVDPHVAKVLKEVMGWLAEDRVMQRDRERLVQVCCAWQSSIQLQGVPRPANLSA
jgi:hypothetical protein